MSAYADTTGSFTARALAAARRLERLERRPRLSVHWPLSDTNPVLWLLHRGLAQRGIAVVGAGSVDDLEDVPSLLGRDIAVLVHVHWTSSLVARTMVPENAVRNADRFIDALRAIKSAGGRLAWTVHNVLPHDSRNHDQERRIRQALADESDLIEVLGNRTVTATSEHYTLPRDKVVVVPHPDYRPVYRRASDPAALRLRLGIGADEYTFGLVGAIRGYKGMHELLDAFDGLCEASDRPMHLIVAGEIVDDEAGAAVADRAAARPNVHAYLAKLSDDDLVEIVDTCNAIVLPYRKTLNSGVLFLALSRNRLVVGPSCGELVDQLDPRWSVAFDPDRPGALIEAMEAAMESVTDLQALQEFLDEHDADQVAHQHATLVDDLLRRPAAVAFDDPSASRSTP